MPAVTIGLGDQYPYDSDTKVFHKPASGAIASGKVVYENGSGQTVVADHSAAASALAIGITFTKTSASGEEQYYVKEGKMYIGAAALTQGVAYYLGTSGQIIPEADLGSGDYVTFLGIASSTSVLDIKIIQSGVAKP